MRVLGLSGFATFILALAIGGCSNGSEYAADPVSQACLECLSERESKGCAAQYAACEEVSACDDYALCQLDGRCFERASGSGCEQEIGCKRPSDSAPELSADAGERSLSPRDLAVAFEKCARSTCAATCGFVE
jgi:hypothetical protein